MYSVKNIPFGNYLCDFFPKIFSKDKGVELLAEKNDKYGYFIERNEKSIKIKYSDLSHLATAVGDIISGTEQENFSHPLNFRGLMLDSSRNAVYNIDFLKETITKLALMGMNYFCLYTEDTYEVEGEPLIGYSRGRYSKKELKEFVLFAEQFGITMFPCIQTLGHLEQILKYSHYSDFRDNDRVLNTSFPKTYDLISKLISNASEPYKSNLIHLGMDETWGIGRGKTFKANTPINPTKIYAEHVAKVAKICEEKGLKPVIWADFVLGSSGEKAMDNESISIIPKNLILNYWNYYSNDEKKYQLDIEKIKNMGFDCIASPGLWNWGNFFPDFKRVRETTYPMMKTLHQEKFEKVMMTMWGDDGNECFFSSCWLALSYYFTLCRGIKDVENSYRKRAEHICCIDFAKFARFEKIGRLPYDSDGKRIPTPKMYFYEDPLYPAAVLMHEKNDIPLFHGLSKFYSKTKSSNFNKLYKFTSLFCEITALKLTIAEKLIKNYPSNRKKLKKVANHLKYLSKKVEKLHSLYRTLWLQERKPFGLEEMDYRLAGLNARIKISSTTIKSYLKGKLNRISELEEKIPLELLKMQDINTARKLRTKSLSLW